jgi:hypothetical protein
MLGICQATRTARKEEAGKLGQDVAVGYQNGVAEKGRNYRVDAIDTAWMR